MSRIPKDIEKYIDSRVAAIRLLTIATDRVLCVRKGVRVKWELKLRYYTPSGSEDKSALVRVEGATFGSGTYEESEDAA